MRLIHETIKKHDFFLIFRGATYTRVRLIHEDIRYFPCYIFLIMCAMSHVFSIKKKYKQAFKAGLAHSMGGLTPTMLNLISNPASIKSMGWSEIGHLLQNVLQNDYDMENSLEDLQELADENRIAYLSGLPILAIFFLSAGLACLCDWKRVMTRIKI